MVRAQAGAASAWQQPGGCAERLALELVHWHVTHACPKQRWERWERWHGLAQCAQLHCIYSQGVPLRVSPAAPLPQSTHTWATSKTPVLPPSLTCRPSLPRCRWVLGRPVELQLGAAQPASLTAHLQASLRCALCLPCNTPAQSTVPFRPPARLPAHRTTHCWRS